MGLRGKEPMSDPRCIELQRRIEIEKYEDAGHGSCWLTDERVASPVEQAVLHFDGKRYRLLAWCIMPNHVHVLIETYPNFPLASVVHWWKSFTANEANRILGREGEFWQREYFDRFIRDEEHLRAAIAYIAHNPVKAGFGRSASQWRFSSAFARSATGSAAFQAAKDNSRQDAGAPRVDRTTGWETMLTALVETGFQITAT